MIPDLAMEIEKFTWYRIIHEWLVLIAGFNKCINWMIWLSGYCRVTDEPLAVYGLSYQWYSFGGFILVIVVGLISSAIKGFQDPKTLDPDLVFNTGETLFWYLPKNAREFLRFNVGDNHVIIIWIIFLRFRSLIFFS